MSEKSLIDDRFPPVPRKVRIRLFPIAFVLFVLMGLLITGYAGFFLTLDSLDTLLLHRRGIDTIAIVDELTTRSGKGTNYLVHFVYDYGGKTYRKWASIGRAEYSTLKRGDTIPVLLDPENAERCNANIGGAARNPDSFGRVFPIIGLACLMMWGVVVAGVLRILRECRRERRALRFGIPIKARITEKEVYQTRNGRFFRINYAFLSPSGPRSGERKNLPIDGPEIFVDSPTVFCVPADPDANAFYPMEWVKLAGSPDP